MRYLDLIWAALFRRKVRTIFTLLSVVTAFLLFGLLDSVRSGFATAGQAGANRLVTASKISFGSPLPLSLYERFREVPGVTQIEYASALAGTYRDPQNFIPVEGHSDSFLDMYPEWKISPSERERYLKTRTGVIASESLAKKYHWKVGDKIPLQTSFNRKDGSTNWTFDLAGTFRITDPSMQSSDGIVYGRWAYVNEAREKGTDTVDWFVLEVPDANDIDRVAREVDALSANSDHETKTVTEFAFYADFLGQLANIGLIVGAIMGAVFFTLVLLTGNTMAQAVRERIPEMATLKAIGFAPGTVFGLVMGESVLLLLLGSALGLAVAAAAIYEARSRVGYAVFMSPMVRAIWLRGLALAVIVGLVVGVLPALRGMRLRIVDALSGR
jgi:putative ABC transport system permease protein